MEEQKIEDFKKVRRSIFKHDKWAAYVLGYDDSYIFTPSRLKSSTEETIAKYEYRIESFVKLLYPRFDFKVYKEAYFFFDAYKDSISSFYKENKDHYKGVEDFVTKLYSEDENNIDANLYMINFSYSFVSAEEKEWIKSLTISYLSRNKKISNASVKNKNLLFWIKQCETIFDAMGIREEIREEAQEISKEIKSSFISTLLNLDIPVFSYEHRSKFTFSEQDWSLLRTEKLYKAGNTVWIFIPEFVWNGFLLSKVPIKFSCGFMFSLKRTQENLWDHSFIGWATHADNKSFHIFDLENGNWSQYLYMDSDFKYHKVSETEDNRSPADFYLFKKEETTDIVPPLDEIIREKEKEIIESFNEKMRSESYVQTLEDTLDANFIDFIETDIVNEFDLYCCGGVYIKRKKEAKISSVEDFLNQMNELVLKNQAKIILF